MIIRCAETLVGTRTVHESHTQTTYQSQLMSDQLRILESLSRTRLLRRSIVVETNFQFSHAHHSTFANGARHTFPSKHNIPLQNKPTSDCGIGTRGRWSYPGRRPDVQNDAGIYIQAVGGFFLRHRVSLIVCSDWTLKDSSLNRKTGSNSYLKRNSILSIVILAVIILIAIVIRILVVLIIVNTRLLGRK